MIVSQVNRDGTTSIWFEAGVMIKVPTHPSQLHSEEWWDAREARIAKMDSECRRFKLSYDKLPDLEQISTNRHRKM